MFSVGNGAIGNSIQRKHRWAKKTRKTKNAIARFKSLKVMSRRWYGERREIGDDRSRGQSSASAVPPRRSRRR